MPAISFSAVEILDSLLNHQKTQTIRPLFCKGACRFASASAYGHIHKPRLKVGNKVKLYWKMRSKDKIFHKNCGNAIVVDVDDGAIGCTCNCLPETWYGGSEDIFEKFLGTAEITEVFEIEMCTSNDAPLVIGYTLKQTEELARLDGFPEKSVKTPDIKYADFWHFFFRYDLSIPRRFAVYRWRYL